MGNKSEDKWGYQVLQWDESQTLTGKMKKIIYSKQGRVLHIDRINMLATEIVKASANICGNVSNMSFGKVCPFKLFQNTWSCLGKYK